MPDTYTHGHQESVLRSHRWRTAENSAAYLLSHLSAGLELLDIGCGPGTITVDLASRVAPGAVVGIDASAEVIAQAEVLRVESGADNLTFATGDVYALEYDDASFDVVHAHQVLQHLTDPVAALTEMRRVLGPNGIVAVRDGDYASFAWAPAEPRIERWNAIYHEVTRRNGAEADAGRYLLGWVRRAGFRDAVATSSTWTYADPQSRAWWGGLWADRCLDSSFAHQAVAYGLSDEAELADVAAGFRSWAAQPDGFFMVPHGEVVAHR